MSVPEVMWRVSQKLIEKNESKLFASKKTAVTACLFSSDYEDLQIISDKLCLNKKNKNFGLNRQLPLLGGYDYERYRKKWNAGFQTDACWQDVFSYFLEYKQRDDIGDARTNWELNRHFQFAMLAKNYMASGKAEYLDELIELFEDWNEKNPFLWGISWTSVMEVAIRVSNWCYTYAFLSVANEVPERLLNELRIGIVNMTDYITKHYSRYSSANNHLIVEAYAIGQSGVLLNHKPWVELAVSLLTRELPLQNYSDGVNKELSLHYQSFYMEAMGLMMRLLLKNGYEVPASWQPMLKKMCRYLSTCIGNYGEVVEFGDSDEGKILDLQGGLNHYKYVLGLFGFLLDEKYITDDELQENLYWLFTESDIEDIKSKPMYRVNGSVCFKEGGNTIMRSNDGKVLIGIDHAALGFGSIAAHGHADALSFQLFVEGQPVFVDPGTYIYHCDIESRNAFRKTENHNTVSIGNRDQSEMLGAFLWGKRAECKLVDYTERKDAVVICAEHDGYIPCIHRRTFEFDKKSKLKIVDEFSEKSEKFINFIFASNVQVEVKENIVEIHCNKIRGKINFEGNAEIVEKKYSDCYGVKSESLGIRITTDKATIMTIIEFY
jgi:hypothetical protein